MGRKLFGIDIAREVYDGIRSAGNVVAMSLVRVTPGTRTTGALTAGTNPSSTTYSCRGFKTSRRRKDPGSTTSEGWATRACEISETCSSPCTPPRSTKAP